MPDTTFSKKEHLCGEIRIAELFKTGNKFLVHPIKVVYSLVPREEVPVKVMMVVPKRNFKRAVHRNRVKRLMREAYRLQKQTIVSEVPEDKTIYVALSFITNELPDYKTVEKQMGKLLKRLAAQVKPKEE